MKLSCQQNHLIVCFCFCFFISKITGHASLSIYFQVCEDPDVETIPSTVCNIPNLMMFQSKMKELCQKIDNDFCKKKLKDYFIIDFGFKNESLIVKSLNYSSYFVSHEYSVNLRNRSNHFDSYISSKKFHGFIIDRSSP